MKKSLLLIVCLLVTLCSPFKLAYAASTTSYEDWLEKYGAWDRLEQQYSDESEEDTPEMILKRAAVYLNLNSPLKALEIIEMTTAFDDNALEADRLWIGGQAHRALGDLTKAVVWFTKASQYIDVPSDLKRKFKNEPYLDLVWQDVWLKLFWGYVANNTLSRATQKAYLEEVLHIGQTVWGGRYWDKATETLTPPAAETSATEANDVAVTPFISKQNTAIIAQAMANVSLEKYDLALELIASIEQPAVQFFWHSLVVFLQEGSIPESLSALEEGNYLKAVSFWEGNLLAPYSTSRAGWLLGNPESGPWTTFRNNLLAMAPEEAQLAIDKELGSMLISQQTAALLTQMKLALSLANANDQEARTAWVKINRSNLPVSLQLAGLLLYNDSLASILPATATQAYAIYPVLSALVSSGGRPDAAVEQASFWLSAPSGNLKKLTQEWPMDKLLLMAYWQQEFTTKPKMELAKRSSYLFEGTDFGANSLIYLADQSVRNKKLQLGAFYLNQMDPAQLSDSNHMAWLDVKTRLEFDAGRPDAALKTFNSMNSINAEIPVMTRLRVALLYQQRKNFDAARQQLIAMWENRAAMSTTLQAETLFWLGEGEHAQRRMEKALDFYLKLAWQYPQENIWALTAMYRASLIYEKRGKYDTAKRLLTTVVKRADRKEQREAAKARINAINKKMGESKEAKATSTLVYPF